MTKKKKYPVIHPSIVKDQHGKKIEVYLAYDVYTSIFEEMKDLKKKITSFKARLKKA